MTLNHLEKGRGGGGTLLSVAVAVRVPRLRPELGACALLERCCSGRLPSPGTSPPQTPCSHCPEEGWQHEALVTKDPS